MPLPSAHEENVVAEATRCAVAFHQCGMLAEAEKFYAAILQARPDHFDALRLLGVLRQQQGNNAEALRLINTALKMNPRSLEALCNFAGVLFALKHYDEALASYDRALVIEPGHPEVLYNRGNTLLQLGRDEEALAAFDRALAKKPDHPEMLVNRGNALLRLDRVPKALAAFDRVLELVPDHAIALGNRGTALKLLGRYEEALENYRKLLELTPDNVAALNDHGSTLLLLKRAEEALAIFDQVLAIAPDQPGALNTRADLLRVLGRHDEAVDAYDKILAAAPHNGEVLYNRGKSLWALGKLEEAMASYEQARAHNHPRALGDLAMCRLRIADWPSAVSLAGALRTHLAEGGLVDPFALMALGLDPSDQLESSRRYVRTRIADAPTPFVHASAIRPDKLRIAYLSSDFRQHPVGTAIAELLERHDKTCFEIVGVSYGSNDSSATRTRIVEAFDQFHDVASDGDRDIAQLLNDRHVHIAVALNGLTAGCRPGVLACRPAAIQVNYLGYAGTTGAEHMDYILADETVLPFDQQRFFTEKIVHLPDCYHVNDATRRISAYVAPRSDLGPPDQGFVFCCFNQTFKIAAPVFEVWMRLLARVHGSVLWLSDMSDLAQLNLRREAAARGIDPDRLIFAPRMDDSADHLARHRAADLFLDTLPYNAHSTTCDALWAGLPVVTCMGNFFAGRVAASMLKAAGLPELVTNNLADYEALALKLASDRALLASIRRKLADNRASCPLFDSDRFRRHIEAAYATMWEIYRRGERPRAFRVEPCG